MKGYGWILLVIVIALPLLAVSLLQWLISLPIAALYGGALYGMMTPNGVQLVPTE
jgi:hypothetical protein